MLLTADMETDERDETFDTWTAIAVAAFDLVDRLRKREGQNRDERNQECESRVEDDGFRVIGVGEWVVHVHPRWLM